MQSTNELLVLQGINRLREATRAELRSLLSLSQASIVRVVADLQSQGFVRVHEATELAAGRGRPSEVLGINPECGYVAGLEFGRNHLIVVFLAADGTLIGWHEVEAVPDFSATDDTMDRLMDVLDELAEQFQISQKSRWAIGLAVHDVVSANGEWMTWARSYTQPYPAQKYLMQKTGRLVHIEDVSRAFAEAEHRFGGGQNVSDLVYLFVGHHGIGSGIFINDQLLKSSLGVCGEIGHITVEADGRLCQCGNSGCLETVATHDAVVSRIRERLDEGVVTSLINDDTLTFAHICRAYESGDKEAHIALAQLADSLASALSGTINIVGATLVLIGGQLRLAGDGFLAELTSTLRQRLIPALAQRITVSYAGLPPHAGAWGVAAQALDAAWDSGSFLQTTGSANNFVG